MSLAPRSIGRVVLAEQVYEVLKERIVDRRWGPDEKINIDSLVRELSVSSTPIREALSRLTAEGLVTAAPFVGYAVAPMPTPQYLRDLYDFRMLVETWAASKAAEQRTRKALDLLESAVAAMRGGTLSGTYRKHRSFAQADECFHGTILAAAANEVAQNAYAGMRVHLHMSRLFAGRDQDATVAHSEHARILDAIRDRAPEKAAAAMKAHLEASRERLIE